MLTIISTTRKHNPLTSRCIGQSLYYIMEIKINILELACELAHRDLVRMIGNESELFESSTDGITNYTEDAQEKFNELYDYYYSIIEEVKL